MSRPKLSVSSHSVPVCVSVSVLLTLGPKYGLMIWFQEQEYAFTRVICLTAQFMVQKGAKQPERE